MKDIPSWQFIEDALQQREQQHRLRSLQPVEPVSGGVVVQKGDRHLVNFSSNDYLGLAAHPSLIERSQRFAEQYGTGATASRLISGSFNIHHRLEDKLASMLGREAVLLFNSGFQANSTIIGTLLGRHSLVLTDKLSHNSLLQGARLSRADFQRFDHNDLGHLEELLDRAAEQDRYDRIMIVTESVFSMDGDRADLDEVCRLADRYSAMLFVDDAHALGVWGEQGKGLTYGEHRIDLVLGTFGKAFGSFGAFVACSGEVRDYLVNFCPGFIYTTALPPPVIGALDAAADLVPEMEEERREYHKMITDTRFRLGEMGYNTGSSDTQIIPLITGSEKSALELARHLEQEGFLAQAIRPPTVPKAGARLRISLSAGHTTGQIDRFLNELSNAK